MRYLIIKQLRVLGLGTLFGGALIVIGGLVSPAWSTETSESSDATKIIELQRRLDQRDALIRNLMRRVDKLEREEAARHTAASQTTPRPPKQAGPPPASSGEGSSPAPVRAATAPGPSPTRQPVQQQQQSTGEPAAAEASGPGQFTVNPEAAEHALERALVQTGAGLLGPWQAELVPSLTFQHNDISRPDQVVLTTTPSLLVAERRVRTTQIEAAGLLRLGLPWDSQVEVSLPYDYKSLSNTDRLSGAGLFDQISDAAGFGDPSLTLTHQLLAEREWRPNLFLSGSWNSNLGQTEKNLPLGTGFDEFKVGLTATKRQDPLVFTSSFSYQASLENKGVQPGDQYTTSLGMLFAVSPETSLQFSQQITFVKPFYVRNLKVPGSDQFSGIFNAGVLSILGPGLVINFLASMGETPDAPDLTLQLSMPIRLN